MLATEARVDLHWIPLGAGGHCIRLHGRVYEALAPRLAGRRPCALYHSALVVHLAGEGFVIEMGPVWNTPDPDRGVVGEGPVCLRHLGLVQLFRYEVRRWRGGRIPDVDKAVDSPQRMSESPSLRCASWSWCRSSVGPHRGDAPGTADTLARIGTFVARQRVVRL